MADLLALAQTGNEKQQEIALLALRTVRPFPTQAIPMLREVSLRWGRFGELLFAAVMFDIGPTAVSQVPDGQAMIERARTIVERDASRLLSGEVSDRRNVAHDFGNIRIALPQVVRALIDALQNDKLPIVRAAAAIALGRLNAAEAMPSLELATKDGNIDVSDSAKAALKVMRVKR